MMRHLVIGLGLLAVGAGALLGAGAPATKASAAATQRSSRTKAEVDRIIEAAGKTAPEWWDKTPLNYPKTLDLTWKGGEGWNTQKDPGCYLWDVIYPNPSKWPEGVKLCMHIMAANKGNEKIQKKAMDSISHLYTGMLRDYARGAYWAKKIENEERLAECYWKLGCREAAMEILAGLGGDNTRNGQCIKLLAEMGEIDMALEWAEQMAEEGYASPAYLAAADACRHAGRLQEAMKHYGKVLAVPGEKGDTKRNKERAQASLEAIKLFDGLDLKKIPDGKFRGSSQGYVGPVTVEVAVKGQRIEAVKVVNHQEKQFYASLDEVPPQIVAKQSVKGIDMTTGATITAEAIVNATAKALAGAQK